MNILIYSFSRCGSSNLLDFLEQEFLNLNNSSQSVKTWFEPFGDYTRMNQFKKWYHTNIDNKHNTNQLHIKNTIVKTISGDLPIIKKTKGNSSQKHLIHSELTWYDQNFNFDKIIILHRENIQDRIESMYAQAHMVENTDIYGDYRDQPYYLNCDIPETELNQRIENEQFLQNQINDYENNDNFLIISYEELYQGNGIDRLKYFLGRQEWYNLDMMSVKHRKRKFNSNESPIVIINDKL